MDGLMRNLRYWSRTIGPMVLMIVAMVLGISLVTELEDIGNIPIAFCRTMSEFGMLYMIFIMGILGFTVTNNYMPFTLSMGSTRRDSFAGMEIMLHLTGLVMVGIIIGAGIITGRKASGILFVSSIIIWLLSVALCNFVGWAQLRFGKAVGLILYILVLFVGVVGMTVLAAMNEAGTFQKLGLPALYESGWQLAAVAAAIVADIVLLLLYKRKVRKMEVRV